MNRNQIVTRSLKRLIYTVCAALLLSGCGRDTSDTQTESGQTGALSSAALEVLPHTLKLKRQEKSYVITGIGMKGETRMAIINDKVVKPGQEIDTGVVLEDVQSTYAIIRVGNTRHLLRPEDIQRELDEKKQ